MPLPAGWRFRYCIFDIEGVLLNARLLAKKTFGRFLAREYGIPASAALVFFTQAQDLTLTEKFQRIFEMRGQPVQELDSVIARFEETVESQRPLVYEGAREVLDALLEKGVLLFAVGSASVEQLRARLGQVDLLGKFRGVLGREAGPKGYPQMDPLARSLGISLADFSRDGIYITASPGEITDVSCRGMAVAGVAHLSSVQTLRESGAPVVLKYIGQLIFS